MPYGHCSPGYSNDDSVTSQKWDLDRYRGKVVDERLESFRLQSANVALLVLETFARLISTIGWSKSLVSNRPLIESGKCLSFALRIIDASSAV